MPKSMLRTITDGDSSYEALMFWCPGCEQPTEDGGTQGGLHMLPVNSSTKSPSWGFDGNLKQPTLTPSILTSMAHARRRSAPGEPLVDVGQFTCHSFLVAGVFQFLGDCTHQYANQHVPLPDLPAWVSA